MHPWLLLFIILANNLLPGPLSQVSITDLGVNYMFGEHMTFQARILSVDRI